MNRDNFLFAIIGLLLGFIIGFMLHGVMSQRDSVRPMTGGQAQPLPANHPAVGNDQGGDPQQVFQQVQAAMKQARALGGDVRLCALQDDVRGIFELTRLARAMSIHTTRQEALASWG